MSNTALAVEWSEELEPVSHLPKRAPLTIRKPDEILAMEFDDSDNIMGDRLMALGQPVTFLGEGGLGKSRLFLQAVASINTGRDFVGLPTYGGPLRVLLIQTENSNRRLRKDLLPLREWVGKKDWPKVNDNLYLHTLETEYDSFVNLDNLDNRAAIEDKIAEIKPDLVAWDPLSDFGIRNLNADEDMRATVSAVSQLSKRGNPQRLIAILHHAGTGKAGAAKATGYDRSSFGRNSKVLHMWTRAQINLAAGNEDASVLIVACGKISNGKPFAPFAIRLNDQMIYEVDPGFDFEAWESSVQGKAFVPKVGVEDVAEICESRIEKPDLVKAIIARSGCGKSRAYQVIDKAESTRRIFYCKATNEYSKNLKK